MQIGYHWVMAGVSIKYGWIDFLTSSGFTHAVTLKPNDKRASPDVNTLHRLFVKVHMLADRRLLGSRFTYPNRRHLRSLAVGIVEGLPDSGHLHGAFKIDTSNWERFEALFQDGSKVCDRAGIWRKLVPHGTSVIERIGEPEGWHRYAFKHVWQCDDSDRVVLLPLPIG